MFGRKKTDRLIENIDKYFDSIDQSLLAAFTASRSGVSVFSASASSLLFWVAALAALEQWNPLMKGEFPISREVGNVLINGAKVVTINSESTEIEDINYLQAIKRVIGMSDKPLANE